MDISQGVRSSISCVYELPDIRVTMDLPHSLSPRFFDPFSLKLPSQTSAIHQWLNLCELSQRFSMKYKQPEKKACTPWLPHIHTLMNKDARTYLYSDTTCITHTYCKYLYYIHSYQTDT